MSDSYWRAVVLMWIALPATWLNYNRPWARLPERVAVHFDASWRPNAWSSREAVLNHALAMTGGLLVVFTSAAILTRIRKPGSAWPMLVICYFALFVAWFADNTIVSHNLPR